ncbi:unnamed protein product, partial [Amoebophrya sp. A120]
AIANDDSSTPLVHQCLLRAVAAGHVGVASSLLASVVVDKRNKTTRTSPGWREISVLHLFDIFPQLLELALREDLATSRTNRAEIGRRLL